MELIRVDEKKYDNNHSDDERTVSEAWDMALCISFRWNLGVLANLLVFYYGLPCPNNKRCLEWGSMRSNNRHKSAIKIPNPETKLEDIWKALMDGRFGAETSTSQGPAFPRILDYIAVVAVKTDMVREKTLECVNRLIKTVDIDEYQVLEAAQKSLAV